MDHKKMPFRSTNFITLHGLMDTNPNSKGMSIKDDFLDRYLGMSRKIGYSTYSAWAIGKGQ